ncbi:sensor histidine kinase [Marinobacterium mangrovicola]|uniref:histidine kinase n=1 Tax=Marinobacterium mangrovicola TaxID=1476959 RepID=A0A4R1GM41_9GAMM|nr:HAMP domain-containing sensor histidine kinase [Marinobacterium mangrovicola]TCK08153.1 signal transduction histidine kinase [Marinobacterium mangrovicola]
MKLNFTTRLIWTIGTSTLVLTSLYFLIGWHYVEGLEGDHEARVLDYLADHFAPVTDGSAPHESAGFADLATLYRSADELPAELKPYADAAQPGNFDISDSEILLARQAQTTGQSYFVYLHDVQGLLAPEDSEFAEAALVLGGILLFTLGTMGLTLSLIWYQTRPVRQLTKAVAAVDPARPELEPLQRDDDLGRMSQKIADLLKRISGFIDRERNFTRFASHELRSPLMAIRSSADLLRETAAGNRLQQRAVARIDVALQRMSKLLDAFLWLSREKRDEQQNLNEAEFNELICQLRNLTPGLDERLEVSGSVTSQWPGDPFVLSVILDNLLRNALDHGEGSIELALSEAGIEISNGIAAQEQREQSHFGYGLQIVDLLCEKAGCRCERRADAGIYRARLFLDQ